tara:strand:+ start:4621 stop:4920 length:300 start_codon:yes stop_codon:yes gene_type:complete
MSWKDIVKEDGVAPYENEIAEDLANAVRDIGEDAFEDVLIEVNQGMRKKDAFELSKIRKLASLLKEFQEFYDDRESKVFGYDTDSRIRGSRFSKKGDLE